jgi:hypothetical protein
MAKKKNSFGKFLAFTTAVAAIGGTCYVFRDKIKACPFYQKSADKLSEIKDSLSDKFCNKEEDDFYSFNDDEDDDFEDVFAEAEQGREYTSITINPKDTTSSEDSENDEATPSEFNQTKTEDAQPVVEAAEEKEETSSSAEPETAEASTSVEPETTEKEEASSSAEPETAEKEEASSSAELETAETPTPLTETKNEDEKETPVEDSIPTITFGNSFSSTHIVTEDSSKENAAAAQVTGYENEGLSDVSEDPDVLEEQDKLDF